MSQSKAKKNQAIRAILAKSSETLPTTGNLALQTESKELRQTPDASFLVGDTVDEDLGDYVCCFLKNVRTTFGMEQLSIETPEEAAYAFERIAEMKRQVDDHLKTAKALKALLAACSTSPSTAKKQNKLH